MTSVVSEANGTLPRVTSVSARESRLNRLWGAVCAFAGIFFLLWALSWLHASVLNEDLQNHCADVHTSRFPFEKSCTHEDGTVEGANSVTFDGIFFGSMSAGIACLVAAFMTEAVRRR